MSESRISAASFSPRVYANASESSGRSSTTSQPSDSSWTWRETRGVRSADRRSCKPWRTASAAIKPRTSSRRSCTGGATRNSCGTTASPSSSRCARRRCDRYPVAPKNCRKTGCISIICSRPIASYNWIMIPTDSRTPVPDAGEIHAIRRRIEQRQEPVLHPVDVREVIRQAADRRRSLNLTGGDAVVGRLGVGSEPRRVAEDGPLRMLPEEEGEHADIREDRGDEDDGDVRGVHQANRISTASSAGHAVGEGKLDPGRFDVGDEEEDRNGTNQADEGIRRLDHDLLDPSARELRPRVVLEIVHGLRNRAGGGGASRPRRLPIEGPREDLLRHAARHG